MGSLNVLEAAAETRGRLNRHDPGVPSNLALNPEPAHSPVPSGMTRAAHFTGVRIAGEGFSASGVVKSVARGVMEVVTTTSVPVHQPLEIAITGCRSTTGEAVYSLPESSACRVGIVFSSGHKPEVEPGTSATIHDLEPPYAGHVGTILGGRNTNLSMFSKTAVSLGAWVRVELEDWVLFGKVSEAMRATATGRLLGIHLHAAFAADSSDQEDKL